MDTGKVYAVITGDIVKSTSLSPGKLELVRENLNKWVTAAKDWRKGAIKGRAEFSRGDTWQLLLPEPSIALRTGILLRAGLIAQGIADTRFSIGIGRVDNLLSRRLSLSTGEAFVLSGHGLDEMSQRSMSQKSRMSIHCSLSFLPYSGLLSALVSFCDSVVSNWTRRQAEIITYALNPKEPIHDMIAESLTPPVSRQAVQKILVGAQWNDLRGALLAFEGMRWTPVAGLNEGLK